MSSQPSIYTSVYPLHIASKLLGFLIFTLDADFMPKFTRLDFIFIALATTINLAMNFIYWTTIFDFVFERSTIINISIPYITLAQNIIVIVIIISSFFKVDDVCEILRKFRDIDEEFENFKVKFDYKSDRRMIIKWIFALFLAIVVILIIRFSSNLYFSHTNSIKTNIYYFWCFCGSTVLLLSFKLAALGVKIRFQKVNECLR